MVVLAEEAPVADVHAGGDDGGEGVRLEAREEAAEQVAGVVARVLGHELLLEAVRGNAELCLVVAAQQDEAVREKHLPGQQQYIGLEAPGPAVDIVPVEDEEGGVAGRARPLEERQQVVELPVHVAHERDGRQGHLLGVEVHYIALLVQDAVRSQQQLVGGVGGENVGQGRGGELPGRILEGARELQHPFARQVAILWPVNSLHGFSVAHRAWSEHARRPLRPARALQRMQTGSRTGQTAGPGGRGVQGRNTLQIPSLKALL